MKAIGPELRKIMKREKLSAYRVAKHFGIARESLYRSLNKDANPEWKRIKRILDYLGYDIKLVKRKGVKPVRPKASKSGRNPKRR